jgi:geranylgeranyl diphosphate synthase, type I
MVVHPNTSQTWQTFRQTFDQHLAETLIKDCAGLPLQQDAFLQELFGHVKALAQQGKRVRPYIASLAYEAAGGDTEQQPWNAWVGIELIHLFALIHDDLIDQGKLRHNVETVQTLVARRLQEQARNGNQPRIADSQALLVGDMVYTWALKHLSEATQEQATRTRVMQTLFQLLEEVIVGQSLDVDLTSREGQPYELIEQKMLLKTARYTFVRPMQLGAALSGKASDELLRFCQEFGDSLGLAFQLQDDWFDLIASEQRTGKSGCRDLEEAQQTFFTCFIHKEGTSAQKERLSRLLGYPLSKEQQEEAYALFTEVGAIKNGERLIEKYFMDTDRILNQANFLPEVSKQAFQSLLTALKTRSA